MHYFDSIRRAKYCDERVGLCVCLPAVITQELYSQNSSQVAFNKQK